MFFAFRNQLGLSGLFSGVSYEKSDKGSLKLNILRV